MQEGTEEGVLVTTSGNFDEYITYYSERCQEAYGVRINRVTGDVTKFCESRPPDWRQHTNVYWEIPWKVLRVLATTARLAEEGVEP
jgi:hypothetical protein